MDYSNSKKNNTNNCNLMLEKFETPYVIFYIFHTIMVLIAVYLSWRCNKGFDLLSFIISLIFPYIYLIYIFSTQGTCGLLPNEKFT